jgi:hypothetical protein
MIREDVILNNSLLKPYDYDVFHTLSEFHLAKEKLDVYEKSINLLGDIIYKYHFNDVVAINLLHKHFDISDDEIVVRTFQDKGLAYMQPEKAINSISQCVPYLWTFSVDSKREKGWYPIEFIKWNDEYCADFELLRYADGFLLELGQKLVELDLQNIFGIAGIYSKNQFHIKTNETLLETTDEVNRILTLKTMPEHTVKKMPDTTKTLWIFS